MTPCTRGLHLKLLWTIPDRHVVGFIMEIVSNRSFVVHTSDGQRSRLRRMKNGVPQGSVLSPMLFNIYISDLPETTSRKYGYADDLAILLRRPCSPWWPFHYLLGVGLVLLLHSFWSRATSWVTPTPVMSSLICCCHVFLGRTRRLVPGIARFITLCASRLWKCPNLRRPSW